MHLYARFALFFYQFLTKTTQDFGALFGGDGPKTKHEQHFASNWSYYIWLMDACGEDITKLEQVIDLPYRNVLTYLAYKTSKNKMIEAINLEEQRKLRR